MKHQNIFFILGIVLLAVMVSQLDFAEVYDGVSRAGFWFFAVIALWAALYVINTASWYLIIRSGGDGKDKIGFWWLYKITVSGFALNYATPGGLMGGEPYRIMELAPKIGTERASSSVILYVMTHIFSHFWFWLLSIVLYVVTQPLDAAMATMLSVIGVFCLLGLWFFVSGYKKGMAVRIMGIIRHVPGIKKRVGRFVDKNRGRLDVIDSQIAALHRQNRRTFVTAVVLELVCRFLSAFEVMFIFMVTHAPRGICAVRPYNSIYHPYREHLLFHAAAARRARGRFPYVCHRTVDDSRCRYIPCADSKTARTCMDSPRTAAHKGRNTS